MRVRVRVLLFWVRLCFLAAVFLLQYMHKDPEHRCTHSRRDARTAGVCAAIDNVRHKRSQRTGGAAHGPGCCGHTDSAGGAAEART